MARAVYLNESQRNLPSASRSSVLSSEEGDNQLCLDSSLHLYQYYFRHIRIKAPPELPLLLEKNDSAKIQFLFYTIKICFRLGWKRSNNFFFQVLFLSQKLYRGVKMDQVPVELMEKNKQAILYPLSL